MLLENKYFYSVSYPITLVYYITQFNILACLKTFSIQV